MTDQIARLQYGEKLRFFFASSVNSMSCGMSPFHKIGTISKRRNGTCMFVQIKTISNFVTYVLQQTIKTIHRSEHTMALNVPLS
jgi:hypothetical protein